MELVHERPWATVRRVPIPGGIAWFKACAPVQAFEPRLTAALAGRWPDRLPEVLAHDEERAWLLLGDAGERLGFDRGPEPWLSVLPRYAELQGGEAVHAAEHLGRGVPDRRVATFPALYEAMLARELPLRSVHRAQLRAFAPRFAELCAELEAQGVPETIQHDDLHGANVYRRAGGQRILDWGDACVSHPFMTTFVTFLHIEEVSGPRRDDAWLARLRDAFLEPWGQPSALRETFELAQRLGAFGHVFKQLRVLEAIPENKRHQLEQDIAALLARSVVTAEWGRR